ncbi:hypothetical protein FFI39_017395 [Janthinobacterium sp. KBS0711]|uniref:hypothetical protein n=1 Tax=Janthinobacterium sp. KBS0711 TaxID=1649647 RepID=UPI000B19BD1E|nr:hypothetical protein [Janthinobacterium sp. KBS0711]TSD72610.1 hypothetical protein FFI39_017395 [Janthinobacterium sp. KBS0711]
MPRIAANFRYVENRQKFLLAKYESIISSPLLIVKIIKFHLAPSDNSSCNDKYSRDTETVPYCLILNRQNWKVYSVMPAAAVAWQSDGNDSLSGKRKKTMRT